MVNYSDKTIERFKVGLANRQTSVSTGTEKLYFALDPALHTQITINKLGSTATLKATNDFDSTSNVDSAIFGAALSTGTDDYQKGSTAGLTGLELDTTAFVGNVTIVINQFVPAAQ